MQTDSQPTVSGLLRVCSSFCILCAEFLCRTSDCARVRQSQHDGAHCTRHVTEDSNRRKPRSIIRRSRRGGVATRTRRRSKLHCQSATASLPGHTEEPNSKRDTPDIRSRCQIKAFCLRMRTKTKDSVHSSNVVDAI